MKFDRKKLISITILIFLIVGSSIKSYRNDTLKLTRGQLEELYNAEFENCIINSVVSANYPSKGYYQLFRVNNNINYYPILLKKGTKSSFYKLFEDKVTITKKPQSNDFTIGINSEKINLEFRLPSDEDTRIKGLLTSLIFFGLPLLLIIFLPNSLFERKR